MADTEHRLTDEKLEEMESGCLPFIPERKRLYRKRWLTMQRPLTAKKAFLRDALYYRNNDNQVGKAVGFTGVGDGFNVVFFTTHGGSLYIVQISASSDGVTESIGIIGST